MSKGKIFLSLLAVTGAGIAIYAAAGTNAVKKIEDLSLVGFKGKITKPDILEPVLTLEPVFVNRSRRGSISFKSFIGTIEYKGNVLSRIHHTTPATIVNDGQPHSIPGIKTKISTLQVLNNALDALTSKEPIELLVKGVIKMDGFTFPVNYPIPVNLKKSK